MTSPKKRSARVALFTEPQKVGQDQLNATGPLSKSPPRSLMASRGPSANVSAHLLVEGEPIGPARGSEGKIHRDMGVI
jgi:hypothetical protein